MASKVFCFVAFSSLLFLASGSCPAPEKLKPCVCDTVDFDNGTNSKNLLKITCDRTESWSILKTAIRPLRRRRAPDWVVDKMEIYGIKMRQKYRLKRFFINVNVREISIYHSQFVLMDTQQTKRRQLPKSFFKNATVEVLEIKRSGLNRVPTGAIRRLSMLSQLNLAFNNIRVIKHKSFRNLDSLKLLDLRGNSISKIPTKALRRIPWLEVLILNDNPIASVDEDSLSALTNLRILDLGACNIFQIHPLAFSALRNLESISLTYNVLYSKFEKEALATLRQTAPNITMVEISGNSINLDNFEGLKLKTLVMKQREDLNGAELRKLNRLFPDLERLDLSDNEIDSTAFRTANARFCAVKEVDLSMTRTKLDSLGYFPNISSLFMEYCKVRRLKYRQFFLQRGKLEKLMLKRCKIKKINRFAFRGLENSLTHLDLERNMILKVSRLTFSRLKNLDYVDLSFNAIRNASYLLNANFFRAAATKLRYLSLKSNGLLEIPQKLLSPLRELQYLNLDRNPITKLDFELLKNRNLEFLSMKDNRISRIHPHALMYMFNLKRLHLSGNELGNSPTPFSSILFPPNLEILDLNNNGLLSITNSVLGKLRKLRSLHLNFNELKRISKDLLSGANRTLIYLDLSVNSLDCSCQLRPFVEWLSEHHVILSQNTKCYFPADFRNHSLMKHHCWSQCGSEKNNGIAFRFCEPAKPSRDKKDG